MYADGPHATYDEDDDDAQELGIAATQGVSVAVLLTKHIFSPH